MQRPIISLTQLKAKVGWNNIVQHTDSCEVGGIRYKTHRLSLQPSQSGWPTIDLYFDENFTRLDPLGFSQWHAHYDSWTNARRNLVEALRAVRELIAGRLCLIEHLDADGKYWGGELTAPGEIPGTLSKKIKRFRRVYFDRAPEFQEIDFSRYWEGKHLLVEWKCKRETEQIWREHNVPITW